MKTNSRIKQLRKEKGITQAELGKIIGVGSTTITGYEKGTITPAPDKLQKLSECFDVSVDYLLCNTDIKSGDLKKMDNQNIESELEALIQQLNGTGKLKFKNGKEIDEQSKALLIRSLKYSIDMAKMFSDTDGTEENDNKNVG